MAFYYSKRKLKPKEREEVGELNIVPYLDILMNLIIFMLMSITGLASFGVLNVTAPSYGAPSAGAAADAPQEEKLQLSVQIAKGGFYISSNKAILGAEDMSAGDDTAQRAPTIPLRGDGSYDFGALTQKMVLVKNAFPNETNVVLVAEPAIPYETLVQVMDAVRETPGPSRRYLFPDVNLGEIIDG